MEQHDESTLQHLAIVRSGPDTDISREQLNLEKRITQQGISIGDDQGTVGPGSKRPIFGTFRVPQVAFYPPLETSFGVKSIVAGR